MSTEKTEELGILKEELNKLINSLEDFEEEGEKLHSILTQLNNGNDTCIVETKHLIWEHYRKYKFKEFILKFHKRIKIETDIVDKNSFKTVDMINNAFCWTVTSAGEGNSKKYNQKYYSNGAFNVEIKNLFELKKKEKNGEMKFVRGSNSDRSLMLKAILGDKLEIKKETMATFIKQEQCQNESNFLKEYFENKVKLIRPVEFLRKNKNNHIWNKYFESEYKNSIKKGGNKTIDDLIKNDLDKDVKRNAIHSIAQISGMGIQLDHVMQRELIKKIVEKLCISIYPEKEKNKKICKINKEINFLYPLMFGCVVTGDENTKLKTFPEILIQNYMEGLTEDEVKQISKSKLKDKKNRKKIAEEIFWIHWEAKKKEKILEMLYQNYHCNDIELKKINEKGKIMKVVKFEI